MSQVEEILTEQFYAWELRGRGWQIWEESVSLEPPFRPFYGHFVPQDSMEDDGRKETALSSLWDNFTNSLLEVKQVGALFPVPKEPDPESLFRGNLVEIHASLPTNFSPGKESLEPFLLSLAYCHEPISFELIATNVRIGIQLAVGKADSGLVMQQLSAFFPEVVFIESEEAFSGKWRQVPDGNLLFVDFGLSREFMFPIATGGKGDPFVGIVGALSNLKENEIAVFQVSFQPLRKPWAESILRSVSDGSGGSFFVNAPELVSAAKNKVSKPLFGVSVRLGIRTDEEGRALEVAKGFAGALRVYAHPSGNEFIPLHNEEYRLYDHEEDMLRRESRRSGMILNSEELIALVQFPTSAVRTPKFRRESEKSKTAPLRSLGVILGENVHAGVTNVVRLSPEDRVRHLHAIGASGMGKSTLLLNLIRQDINENQGLAVFDPHGDLIEKILRSIPEHRIEDVVLIDPADEAYSVGFNILSAHTDLEKNLLASDLVSVFKRLSTSWGDQMGSVLSNAILAFLESSQGGTLADLRRFLIEPKFRESFLRTVADPEVHYYWKKGFPLLSGSKSIGPILTRLETFLSPKIIRYMVSQKVNRLDFSDIMNGGKIFLANLSQGRMGKENSYLMGSLLMAKFQQTAMSRQNIREADRRDFFLYADEFHHFITPSMSEILTEARKYRVGLILAHQELKQLDRDIEVASAVLSNPYTRICFRVGDSDAKTLANGFSYFVAKDLQNLDSGQAIGRIGRADGDFNLTVPFLTECERDKTEELRNRIIEASRRKHAVSRAEIEAELRRATEHLEIPNDSQKEPKPEEVTPAPVSVLPPPSLAQVMASVVPAQIPISTPPSFKPRSTPGRGGNQHKAMQQRIKSVAESLGYGVTIEKTVAGGSIDLVVEKAGRAIAGEIALTNTIDYEVGNVIKCKNEGFAHIAIISPNEEHLAKIRKAVVNCLATEEADRVGYYTPDQFIDFLQQSALQDPPLSAEPKIRLGKYKVRRTMVELSEEERKSREASALAQMADFMKQKKTRK